MNCLRLFVLALALALAVNDITLIGENLNQTLKQRHGLLCGMHLWCVIVTHPIETVEYHLTVIVELRQLVLIQHQPILAVTYDLHNDKVMNEGNIIEQGTHDGLMKQNGFYAGLYNSQFKL